MISSNPIWCLVGPCKTLKKRGLKLGPKILGRLNSTFFSDEFIKLRFQSLYPTVLAPEVIDLFGRHLFVWCLCTYLYCTYMHMYIYNVYINIYIQPRTRTQLGWLAPFYGSNLRAPVDWRCQVRFPRPWELEGLPCRVKWSGEKLDVFFFREKRLISYKFKKNNGERLGKDFLNVDFSERVFPPNIWICMTHM